MNSEARNKVCHGTMPTYQTVNGSLSGTVVLDEIDPTETPLAFSEAIGELARRWNKRGADLEGRAAFNGLAQKAHQPVANVSNLFLQKT